MKILAIRIKNLASLEGNTEIDFTSEPLCSAGIFAITGVTGAGKSTILDALCLALYAKTPRYLQAREQGIELSDVKGNMISQGDVRGILRDGTAEGFAEVDFVGIDKQKYRATWKVTRARNSVEGRMQADTVTLKNITSDVVLSNRKTESLKEIERLVGLSFEQFTRSVLLAQGDFTAFMKANKDEKSSLLEKLTGMQVYSEISRKVYEKSKIEEQLLRDLNLQKEGVQTLTESELDGLQTQQLALETQVAALEKELEKLTAEISWHERLAQLQSHQLLAHTALQAATAAIDGAAMRKEKLFQAEQAQRTRAWADALRKGSQQKTETTAALARLQHDIAAIALEKGKLERQLTESGTALAAKNKAYADALPFLEEAKRLDTLLSEKKEQLQKAGGEADAINVKSEQHQAALASKQATLSALSAAISALESWKAEHAGQSLTAENKDLIVSKLREAQKHLETIRYSSADIAALAQKILAKDGEKTQLEATQTLRVQEWETLKRAYDAQAEALLLIPVERLSLEKESTGRAVQKTLQAQSAWQSYYSLSQDVESVSQKQLQQQTALVAKQAALEQLDRQLETARIQKDTAAQLLQQARLASTEHVEKLRAGLVDNTPCPVCGSESHPYAEHNPQLQNVLAALEKTNEDKERAYLSTLRQQSGLRQECETMAETIRQQHDDIRIKTAALDVSKQAWKAFELAVESDGVPDFEKASWIETKWQGLQKEEAILQQQIQEHALQKQQLESAKTKLEQLKSVIDKQAAQIKDDVHALALFRQQQAGRQAELEQATMAVEETETLLQPYFNSTAWMENWKKAPLAFLQQIEDFAKKWKEKTERLEENIRQHGLLSATLKEWETQAEGLVREAAEKAAAFSGQTQAYRDIERQRNAIFGGMPATATETQLKQAVTIAQQQNEMLKSARQQLDLDSTKAGTQKEQLLENLAALETDIATNTSFLEDWLRSYNAQNSPLDMPALQQLLLLSSEWIETERKALQALEDEVTKARSILAERTTSLETHRQNGISDRPLDALLALSAAAKQEAEQKKHTKSGIAFSLKQDQDNKTKIGSLLKSIVAQAAVAENWSRLNEVIGSSDGKKFRHIAQEYTLDVLLGYANIHLQVLASRYKIERIPNTLALQVVDGDMGDEVRTVYSLSGGESFLVSLALALGLASLSSSRMKVESLFIDEGFGSLDPATLTVAMDALERLHNQGRKVGVISHVQEMTERIGVQVKVSKMVNGRSKVEVLG